MIPFFENAHSIICTYGNTTYESLTYHQPTFIVSYSEFQYEYSNYLEKLGIAINLGYLDSLNPKNFNVIYDHRLKRDLIKKTKKIFIKPGIVNISNIIIDEIKNV